MSTNTVPPRLALLVFAALLSVSGCRSAGVIRLSFDQGPPTFHNPPTQIDGNDYEAISSFQAPLLSSGKMVGELVGIRQVAEKSSDLKEWGGALRPDGFDAKDPDQLLFMYTMMFNLGGEDVLLVQGPGIVEAGPRTEPAQMRPDTPEVRSIVGGTGKYRYARGQVVSTRMTDGRYRHVLDFKN